MRALQLGLWVSVLAGCPQVAPEPPAAADTAAGSHPDPTSGSAEEATRVAEREEAAWARRLDLEHRAFPLLAWSAHAVLTEYYDPRRFSPVSQVLFGLTRLGHVVPEFFSEPNPERTRVRVTLGTRTREVSLEGMSDLVDAAFRLEEVLSWCREGLTPPPTDDRLHELEYAAIGGLLWPLDPHTVLLTPEQHAELGIRTKGHFGGIGAQIRPSDRRIRIVGVLPGMPAEAAGLRPGDLLVRIGRASTVNLTGEEAQALLRGPVGSIVEVVYRRGSAEGVATITRQVIRVPAVRSARLDGAIGVLRIDTFQENTGDEVVRTVGELGRPGPLAGLILDLRGNGGGLLTQATAVVDAFVDEGSLVIVRSRLGREADPATPGVVLPASVPIVVLIDEESASASEIVAGGLSALGRAMIVGRRSFGKGTVQMLKPARPYGRELALKLTIAEYLVEGDRRIQTRGVQPDLELIPVQPSGVPKIWRYFDDERFDRAREAAQASGLPSAVHETPPDAAQDRQALLRLHYLHDFSKIPPLPPGVDEDAARLAADPEIALSRDLLASIATDGLASPPPAPGEGQTGWNRERLAREIATRAAPLMERADDAIVERLRQDGVDWRRGDEVSLPGSVVVRAKVASPGPVSPGKPFPVALSVENRGEKALSRVRVVTDCAQDELDGIEWLVGSLPPGTARKFELSPEVAAAHDGSVATLRFEAFAGPAGGAAVASTSLLLEVASLPRPRLAFDAWIVDDADVAVRLGTVAKRRVAPGEAPFVVAGDGDGVASAGERVLLAVSVQNQSANPSPNVRAVLRNRSSDSALLEEGLVELGRFAPGEVKVGSFGVTVHATPAGQAFDVELAVLDVVLRTGVERELSFPLIAAGQPWEARSQGLEVLPGGARLYDGAHPKSARYVEVPPGRPLRGKALRAGWWRLDEGPAGRSLFVPEDRVAKRDAPTPRRADPLAHAFSTVPPELRLAPTVRRTGAPGVVVRGDAIDDGGVRDLVVLVRPERHGAVERKVAFVAHAPEAAAKGAPLVFETEVPLEPGSNRVRLRVRDREDLVTERVVFVYREAAEVASGAATASPRP